LTARFHLRPRPTADRLGPELPPSTVQILALSDAQRIRFDSASSTALLAHVRDPASGDEGYAFVRLAEFDPACPLFIDSDVRGESPPVREEARHQAARAGEFARPDDLIVGGVSRGEEVTTVVTVDLDGDGREDRIRRLSRHGTYGSYILQRHGVGGWRGEDVLERDDHDHHRRDFAGVMRAGGSVLLRIDASDEGGLAFICTGASNSSLSDAHSAIQLLRWNGHALDTVLDVAWPASEPIQWEVEGDGTLRAVTTSSRRIQRFAWRDDLHRFVPVTPTLPSLDIDPQCSN